MLQIFRPSRLLASAGFVYAVGYVGLYVFGFDSMWVLRFHRFRLVRSQASMLGW